MILERPLFKQIWFIIFFICLIAGIFYLKHLLNNKENILMNMEYEIKESKVYTSPDIEEESYQSYVLFKVNSDIYKTTTKDWIEFNSKKLTEVINKETVDYVIIYIEDDDKIIVFPNIFNEGYLATKDENFYTDEILETIKIGQKRVVITPQNRKKSLFVNIKK